jgi:hypothetical protein
MVKHEKKEIAGNVVEWRAESVDASLIRIRAYQIWQARGCPGGSNEEDWFIAEQELRHRRV